MDAGKPTLCIIGGTGFVGTHLLIHLAREGCTLRVLTRRRERHKDLLVLPTLELVETDVHDEHALRAWFAGCDAVINLAGIVNERRRGDFERAHVSLPEKIARACLETGVKRLLHMSALNADAEHGASRYLRSKGEGENHVHAMANKNFHVTSFRPAIIFGPGDHLFTRLARLLKTSPGILPLPCPETKFAPVFVEDVVHAYMLGLSDRDTYGRRYDLCGPRTYTFRQLAEYARDLSGAHCAVVGLPDLASALLGRLMGLLPGKPYSHDNYLSMHTDSVCKGVFPEVFHLIPTLMEAVVPYYLLTRDRRGQFEEYRRNAKR